MTLFAVLLTLATVATPSRDLKTTVAFSIATDRHDYVQHDLVRLTTTIRNIGSRPIDHDFWFDPIYAQEFSVWYRRVGTPFVKYGFIKDVDFLQEDLLGGRGRLQPGDTYSEVMNLAYNSSEGSWVLGLPGEYEVQVRYDPEPMQTGRRSPSRALFESNIVRVTVTPPGPEEQEAFAAYTSDLARLAQLRHFPGAEQFAERALEFYERHPDSIFAEALAQGLMPMLWVMLQEHRAPSGYAELFERLQAKNAAGVKPPGRQ